MTHHQFGTLKYVRHNDITLKTASELSMNTFGSLIKRGWIARNGSYLRLTDAGEEAYESYSKAVANFRKYDTGLTDHVKHLLHLDRVLTIGKDKIA